MPSYLNESSSSNCVSTARVKGLFRLLILCAFDASSFAVVASIAGVLSVSSAAIFCFFSFFLSLFLLDTCSFISQLSRLAPIRAIGAALALPQVVSLLWLLFLLDFARCPGQPPLRVALLACLGFVSCAFVAFGVIYYLAIYKLYINSFFRGYFQIVPDVTTYCFVLLGVSAALFWISRAVFLGLPFAQFSNESLSNYVPDYCIDQYGEVLLDFFRLLFIGIGFFHVNSFLIWELQALFILELQPFVFLQNTAEALHLFDEEMKKCFQNKKASACSLKRFNFERIQAEVAGRGCNPPEFLADEQETLLQSDKIHLRVLRRLPNLAYAIISVNQNDIVETIEASHTKLWWKARIIERAGGKEEIQKQGVIPSKIKLSHLFFAAGGATSMGTCLDCFPMMAPTLAELLAWSDLNGCIFGEKAWQWVELEQHEFLRQTYEFVERREGFRRRSLVLLGAPQLTTPMAEALEKQQDSSFVAGFQVAEQKQGFLFLKKDMEEDKEKLSQAIRSAINLDQIPVITTATWLDEAVRNPEFAPLVIFVGWMKEGKTKNRNPCKYCELIFDAELKSRESETAGEELRGLWDAFHQGHQWIPIKWLRPRLAVQLS